MKKKKFAVVNMADDNMTAVYQKRTLKKAQKLAVKLAMEQGEITKETAQNDLERQGSCSTNNDTVTVFVREIEE